MLILCSIIGCKEKPIVIDKQPPNLPTAPQKHKTISEYGFWATKLVFSSSFYGNEYVMYYTYLAKNADEARGKTKKGYYNSKYYNPTITIKKITVKFGVLYDPLNAKHVKFANDINEIPDANYFDLN